MEDEGNWCLIGGILYKLVDNTYRKEKGPCAGCVVESATLTIHCTFLPNCSARDSIGALSAGDAKWKIWVKVFPILKRIRHPSK